MKRVLYFAALATTAAGISLSGCVERKITVISNPEGALLTLNDVEVGRTPVTVPFTWYGDYDVQIRADKDVAATALARNREQVGGLRA